MEEQDYNLQISRGHRAAQLRKDPLLCEFIDNLRETVYENIRTSSRQSVDEREELYKMLQVIDSFEKQFKKAMDDGKLATSRLEALKNTVKGIF